MVIDNKKGIIVFILFVIMVFGFSGLSEASSGSIIDTFLDGSMIASTTNLDVNTTEGNVSVEASSTSQAVTLRPNGVGSETSIPNSVGGSNHWECVDEVSPDYFSSYVYFPGASETWKRDLYNLTDPAVSGVINNLTAYRMAINNNSTSKSSIRTHENTYDGSAGDSSVWTLYSYNWANNPFTGSAWTWDEINNLEAGVNINCGNAVNSPDWADVTQVYVTVNYFPYESSGELWSTNLLSGQTDISSIDSFDYNASLLPTGTNLKVQFSQDNSTWYDSSGLSNGWETLSEGDNSIDLSSLGWSGEDFYYKTEFTSDVSSGTPILDEISVTYTSGVIPEPASLLLLGFGVTGLAFFRKRKL